MKQHKSKDIFKKEKILERNSRIENYIVHYLSSRNEDDIPYNNDKKQYIPLLKKTQKISNSRPKISRVPPRKKIKEMNSNSFIHTHMNNNSQKNYSLNTNKIDSEDAMTIATRKTMASIRIKKIIKKMK